MSKIYSIGHSTRTLDELVELLQEFGIELLADIRRFPGSRKHPQFNKDNLQVELPKCKIEYAHFEALGGRRRALCKDSPNGGWRHPSFRSYADYTASDEFKNAVKNFLEVAGEKRVAMMCAEAVYWRCHRRIVSDYLFAVYGITVKHILGPGQLREHELTDIAHVENGELTYPPPLWQ